MAHVEKIEDVLDMDVGGRPFRAMLKDLLTMVLLQGEEFDGKRPWGDSGWEWDIYNAMVVNGFVRGVVDEYGDVDGVDITECDELIMRCVEEIFDK